MRRMIIGVLVLMTAGCTGRLPSTSKEAATSSEKVYYNPVDKKAYVAQSGWKTYEPETPKPAVPGQKVKSNNIRLLTSEEEIAARTTVPELVAYIQEADRIGIETLGKSNSPFRLTVQFHCKPIGHEIKMAHVGEAPKESLEKLYDALLAAPKLPVKDGEVAFQLEFVITP